MYQLRLELLEDRTVLSMVDLSLEGAIGSPNGNPRNGIFRQVPPQPTGTGVIQSFVRMQTPNGQITVEHGYNTSVRPVEFNEKSDGNFTRDLAFSAVPRVNLGGRMYLEFLLDVNEPGGGSGLISLDELRIFGSSSPLYGYTCTGTAPTQTCTLGGAATVFNLDASATATDDHWVQINARLNNGSGSGDLLAYLPLPSPTYSTNYIHLYSKLGVNRTADGGFEEWWHGTNQLTPAAGVIRGTKFEDLNGNAVRDTGEPDLPGWTIFLDANDNGILDADEVSTTTSATGEYEFTNLATGLGAFSTYRVREVQQEAWIATHATNGHTVSLTNAGQVVTGRDFGNFGCFAMDGRVFRDLNGDGSHAGDPIHEGARVNAYRDVNGNNQLDIGTDTLVVSRIAEASGFSFHRCFGPGVYFVNVIPPTGWMQTEPVPPGLYTVVGQSRVNVLNLHFSIFQLGRISGTKFNDLNGNGTRDTGEPGLPGWTINLGGTQSQTAITDANGNYTFANLPLGSYTVSETQQSGWVQTAGPASYSVNVATSGSVAANQNFGNFRLFTISGRFFEDIFKDISGVGDPGYNGFRFDLHRDADGNGLFNLNIDPLVSTTTTATVGDSGFFSFPNLGPGTYFVRRFATLFNPNLPPGVTNFVWTVPPAGQVYTVVGQSGVDVLNRDYGLFRCANFTGRVFVDLNGDGDGTGDPTYNVVEGVPVYYFRDSNGNGVFDPAIDPQVGETLGEASGISFHGCVFDPGTYFFTIAVPTGYIQTAPVPPAVVTHSVRSGTTGSVLFGIYQPSSAPGGGSPFPSADVARGLDDTRRIGGTGERMAFAPTTPFWQNAQQPAVDGERITDTWTGTAARGDRGFGTHFLPLWGTESLATDLTADLVAALLAHNHGSEQ